jgi:hypothetical protein
MTAPELQECLDALPPDIRRELDEIREVGRGPFGRAQTQQIVDDHLGLLGRLRRDYHATHADLVDVLSLCGITGPYGAALTAATLSSAISRANAKAKAKAKVKVSSRSSQPRARTTRPTRVAGRSPVSKLQGRHADDGDPGPDLILASQAAPPPRTVVQTHAGPVVGTQVCSSGPEPPAIRRSDRERQIDFLARSMED